MAKFSVHSPLRIGEGAPVVVPEFKNEVWHENELGDWEMTYCEMQAPGPTPAQQERHALAASKLMIQTAAKWAAIQEADGKQCTSRWKKGGSWVAWDYAGPFMVQEEGKVDLVRYYIFARWQRTKPLIMDLDEAQRLADNYVPEDLIWHFLQNMKALSGMSAEMAQREASKNAQYTVQAERERKFREGLAWLAQHRDHTPAQRKRLLVDNLK